MRGVGVVVAVGGLGVWVALQRWTGGSWVGPVWSGACRGGPDSPMETWEKDKLVH